MRRSQWVKSVEARSKLSKVINGVLASHPGRLHYYQGLHDVAAVLVRICGNAAAPAMLERLTLGHLRDCVRGSLDPVLDALSLLPHLIAVAAGLPPLPGGVRLVTRATRTRLMGCTHSRGVSAWLHRTSTLRV